MIYLCSVYSVNNASKELMQIRYEYVRKKTAEFLMLHVPIFSPIVHCHEVAKHFELPKTWEFWKEIDFAYLNGCTAVFVLKMPHWKKSVGVNAEIEYAKSNNIPVHYILCNDYVEVDGGSV